MKTHALLLAFLLNLTIFATAQTRTIQGKVTNELGETLTGVKVVLVGSGNVEFTNENGEYAIQVTSDNLALSFSLNGYKEASATIGIYDNIDMVMISDDSDDLAEMSLEDLLDMEIVSVSKKAEKISDAPSNISVVTAQNIKEWGCRDLKDVIRRITGYNVIADRDEWVFASRGNVGDNNQKYLVLIDGHRMNSIENFGPGNIIEIPNNLSNIKRIEIIRGPGSAVWGADALAGVINILTKNLDDMEHYSNASLTYGTDNYMLGDFQIGTKVSDKAEILLMGAFSKQDGKEVKQEAATTLPYMETAYNYGNHPHGKYNTILDKHNFGYMVQMKAKVNKIKINAMVFETEVFNRHFEWGLGRENYLTTHKNFVEATYDKSFNNNLDISLKLATDQNYSEYSPRTQGDSTKLPFNIAWRDRGLNGSLELMKTFGNNLKIYGGV
ncbi:MAG: TonB-dependent receptor, partial [Bacteroidales bacterium]|nr:TonB-dependent receptor [Bacteroidales bacterium]